MRLLYALLGVFNRRREEDVVYLVSLCVVSTIVFVSYSVVHMLGWHVRLGEFAAYMALLLYSDLIVARIKKGE